MTILLKFADDRMFADGATTYLLKGVTREDPSRRIYIPVSFENIDTFAVLDTAAHYVVCRPDLAKEIGLLPSGGIGRQALRLQGLPKINGSLHRVTIRFRAEVGDELDLEVTAFVPSEDSAELWGRLPNYLGLFGCLERIRFALDPDTETFYFSSDELSQ